MEMEESNRGDFPRAHGAEGFDIDSVGAHLAAVTAHVAALEARITALEVEREKLRQQLADAGAHEDGPTGYPEPGPDPLVKPGGSGQEVAESPPAVPEPDSDPGAVTGAAEVAARMFASKLAMGDASRDTIIMRVAAEHAVEDPGALVDDVLARLA